MRLSDPPMRWLPNETHEVSDFLVYLGIGPVHLQPCLRGASSGAKPAPTRAYAATSAYAECLRRLPGTTLKFVQVQNMPTRTCLRWNFLNSLRGLPLAQKIWPPMKGNQKTPKRMSTIAARSNPSQQKEEVLWERSQTKTLCLASVVERTFHFPFAARPST